MSSKIWLAGLLLAFALRADTQFRYAAGVRVEPYQGYPLVVINPGGQNQWEYRYLLVPHGISLPKQRDITIVVVPLQRFTVDFPTGIHRAVEDLGLTDNLVGISASNAIYPQMSRMYSRHKAGLIVAIGGGQFVDLEKVALLKPDGMLCDFVGSSNFDVLRRVGYRPIPFANRLEKTPLGSAEWIKLLGMLTGKEAQANAQFEQMASRYLELKRIAGQAKARSKVLPRRGPGDLWTDRAAERQLIRDAGGVAVPPERSHWQYFYEYPYELILAEGLDASVWPFAPSRPKSIRDLVRSDGRLARVRAVLEGNVYHANNQFRPGLVDPFFTASLIYPDTVLADLIHLLHPHLLPNHKLIFFRRIPNV